MNDRLNISTLSPYLHAAFAALLLLVGGWLLFSATGRDDVYKTLWPAWTFSEHNGIFNYSGEVFEQSSSLLQVLMLGTLHKILGGDIVWLGHVLTLLFGVGMLFLLVRITTDFDYSQVFRRWLPWLVASHGFFLYWSWGGLDAVMAAFFLLWMLYGLLLFLQSGHRTQLLLSMPLFLLARPENGLIALLGMVVLAILRRRGSTEARVFAQKIARRMLVFVGIVLAFAVLIALLRLWLFGLPFPHPVLAKADGFSLYKLYKGAAYLFWEATRYPALWLLVAGVLYSLYRLLLVSATMLSMRAAILTAFLVAQTAFVLFSGGDWMENGRFLVPIVPLLLLVLPLALPTRLKLRHALGILLAAQFLNLYTVSSRYSTGRPAWTTASAPADAAFCHFERHNRVHARDIPVIHALDSIIATQPQRPVSILSQQAGMVMFHTSKKYFRQLRFIDLVGLSSADFTECSITNTRGRTYGGLNMDLYYLFEDYPRIHATCGFEKPDIIFDLDNERHEKANFLRDRGYRIVYQQDGWMETGSRLFPGLEVGAWSFIAVSEGNKE